MLKAHFEMRPIDAPRVETLHEDCLSMVVNKKLLEFDLELFQTKWFDYRTLTPFAATMHYAEAYQDIYRQVYAAERDYQAAKYVRVPGVQALVSGLRNGDTKTKSVFTGYWRGRQVADALGMPYAVYIEWAFTFRLRHWQQRYLPRPDHLYRDYVVEKVQDKWEELQTSRLWLSQHPAYLVQNYAGIPYQDDYHEWLFKQANIRANPEYFLARFVNDHALPIEKVQTRLDGDALERFERYLQ